MCFIIKSKRQWFAHAFAYKERKKMFHRINSERYTLQEQGSLVFENHLFSLPVTQRRNHQTGLQRMARPHTLGDNRFAIILKSRSPVSCPTCLPTLRLTQLRCATSEMLTGPHIPQPTAGAASVDLCVNQHKLSKDGRSTECHRPDLSFIRGGSFAFTLSGLRDGWCGSGPHRERCKFVLGQPGSSFSQSESFQKDRGNTSH